MSIEKTQHLISQVGGLLKSYEKLAKSTGENFNIFTVMGMESNEVKTHSAIIGELLNPKGSHGLGNKPLKLFLDIVVKPMYGDCNSKNFDDKFGFDFENTQSIVEDFAGKINEDATEGGRIDIVVKDNKEKVFLIENKIYAGEQKNQLTRYNNFYKNAPILFLTLYGKDAESAHDLERDTDYFTISYEKDILLWLEECVKEAVKLPMLREVIYQYIYLIKKLTHQTINNELKMEISDLIKNNLEEASAIAKNFENVKKEIITDFWKKTEILCKNSLGSEWEINTNPDLINRFNHMLFHQIGNDIASFYCRYNKNNGEINYGIILNPVIQKDLNIKCKDVFDRLDNTLKLPGYNYGDQSVIWIKNKNYNFNDVGLLSKMNIKGQELAAEFADEIKSFIEKNLALYTLILNTITIKNQN